LRAIRTGWPIAIKIAQQWYNI